MSAFLVSKHDIDILVTAYTTLRGNCSDQLAGRLGAMLWRENVLSLVSLYGHKPHCELVAMWPELETVDGYAFEPIYAKAAAVAKIARCYDYQSCEHDGWADSRAKAIVETLMAKFPDTLPGYDDMPWGISDARDLAKARV